MNQHYIELLSRNPHDLTFFTDITLREKCPNTEFFSGQYFPVFGQNTEILLLKSLYLV